MDMVLLVLFGIVGTVVGTCTGVVVVGIDVCVCVNVISEILVRSYNLDLRCKRLFCDSVQNLVELCDSQHIFYNVGRGR